MTSSINNSQGINAQTVTVDGNVSVGPFTIYNERPPDIKQQSIQYSKIQANIKGMLRRHYGHTQMPKMLWMHDWYHPLKDYYVDLTLHSKQHEQQLPKKIQLEDMFQPTGNNIPKRILVEGPAGYGKTTLALKLCHDWASGAAYINNFEIVLLVQLRNLKQPLVDIIGTLCQVSNVDSGTIVKSIRNCEEKVLLILDGYDEVPPDSKQYIVPLMKSEEFSEMTVIVTSRNGLFELEDMEVTHDGDIRQQIKSMEFITFTYICDKRITIRGITDSSKIQFLEKYFENMPNQEQVAQAKEALSRNFGLRFDNVNYVESTLEEDSNRDSLQAAVLLECPLFLLLIVILVSETKVELLKSKTELYKVLFNFVVRRGLSKIGISDEINMFDFNKQDPPSLVTSMNKFAEFALDALKENKVSFQLEEIMRYCEDDIILKLGFMTKNESVTGLRNTVSYEPIHKSVLEFAAAYHLWYAFYTDCSEKELTVKLTSAEQFFLNTSVHATSLVCKFVIGLMGDHVTDLLKAWTRTQDTSNTDTSWFKANSAILEECPLSEKLVNFLSSFVTPVWLLDTRIIPQQFFQTRLHEVLMEYGLEHGIVTSIFWHDECRSIRFPKFVKVDKIVLQMETGNIDANISGVQIISEEIYCWICSGAKRYWQNLKSLLRRITFQRISFQLTKDAASFLFHLKYEVSRGMLRTTQIHWIRCELYHKKSHFLKILSGLIGKEKLSGIYLTFLKAYESEHTLVVQSFKSRWCLKCLIGKCDTISEDEWQLFVKRCRKSQRLQDFVLTNFDIPLSCDLHQLCNRGRSALRIDLQQNIIISPAQQRSTLQTTSVKHFRATDFLECHFDIMVSDCHIQSLECSNVHYKSSTAQLLKLLQRDGWPICTTLTHLYIVIDRDYFENGYFSRIEKLHNLNVLALEIDSVTIFSRECGMEQMLLILQRCTFLERLEFWNIQYLRDQPDFFTDIAMLVANNGVCIALRTIMLQGDINEATWGRDFNELLEFLVPLQDMMVRNHLLDVWLVNEEQHYFKSSKHDWETTRLLEKCLQSIFAPEEGFEIVKDLLGMKEIDSVWSKRGWENPFEKHTNFKFYKHSFYSQNRFCIRKEMYVTHC